jgi:hypothetical protein
LIRGDPGLSTADRREPSLLTMDTVLDRPMAATLFQREAGGPWIATAHTDGETDVPGLGVSLPLADCYEGLELPPQT